jgi:hypothetical protein
MAAVTQGYGREDGDVPGYAGLMGLYGATAAAVAVAAWRTGRRPSVGGPVDVALLALAMQGRPSRQP